jgi:hypothetical protein
MALSNARIDQHPLGIPNIGDFGIYRDMATGVTRRYSMDPFILSPTSTNIEWTSAKAAAGDYDIDVIVTRGGDIWQSTVDNNESIPGADETWTKLTRGRSGLALWEAGVFLEDNVFVARIIGNKVHLFYLDNETRPYNSTDFDVEFIAGDWVQIGSLEIVEVDVSGASATLNFLYLDELAFKSANIDHDINVIISNDTKAIDLRFWKFSANAGVKLTFESNMHHLDWDGNWLDLDGLPDPTGLTWTCPVTGTYILEAVQVDGEWYIKNIYGIYQ